MYACESPIRTTTFLLEPSPRRQILVAITELLSWPRQLDGIPYGAGWLSRWPIDGESGDGSGAPSRAARTAAITVERAPFAVDVGPRIPSGVVRVVVGPWKRSCSRLMPASEPTAVPRKTATQASTTTSVFARLRIRRRIGFSTSA